MLVSSRNKQIYKILQLKVNKTDFIKNLEKTGVASTLLK